MRRGYVLLGLAVIAAVAIASPVFGLSSSLKKAIKKEVSKQLAKTSGPSGPPGAAGQPGAAGSAVAYIRVAYPSLTFTVISANTKNATATPDPDEFNEICVTVSVPFSNVVASVDGTGSVGENPDAAIKTNYTPDIGVMDCPAGTDVEIKTDAFSGGNVAASPFSAAFFN
jgi:hypothetical protein